MLSGDVKGSHKHAPRDGELRTPPHDRHREACFDYAAAALAAPFACHRTNPRSSTKQIRPGRWRNVTKHRLAAREQNPYERVPQSLSVERRSMEME